MVDDAHGFGPLGAQGGGIAEHFGLGVDDVPVLVGTLGKAFGTSGAFVAGSEELIESLIQFARPYIYTTSQPPALAWLAVALFVFFCGFNALEATQPSLVSRMAPPALRGASIVSQPRRCSRAC